LAAPPARWRLNPKGKTYVALSFREDFRRFFLRGLAAVLPTLLTLSIIIYVFTRIQQYIGKYINIGLYWVIGQVWMLIEAPPDQAAARLVRDEIRAFWIVWEKYWWWVGFVLAFVAIYIFGRFVGSFLGRSVWRMIEGTFLRLPLIRQLYPYVKQVTDFLLSERKIEFSRVVAVKYPREGVWSLGLVTGPAMRTLSEATGEDLLTVFIPSSPTPVTGYTITVKRSEVIDLPLSVDDALRFTISGGVITPFNQQAAQTDVPTGRNAALPGADKKENSA
jgi:uncharacterized membrane protein